MKQVKQNLVVASVLAIAGSFVLSAPAAADSQTVYRAVDELGNPAFTDRPEEYDAAEAVLIAVAASPTRKRVAPPTGAAASSEDGENKSVAEQIREQHAAEDAAEQARQDDVKAQNCDRATKRFDKYKSARRLFRQTDDGEREYLSDDETDAARNEAASSVDRWCGS